MNKKKARKNIFDQYRSLKDEMVFNQIREALSDTADTASCGEGKLDLECIDHITDEDELQDEEAAVPENINQEFLVAYFEGYLKLSDIVLEAYNTEKSAESPNFPLLRRYFRKGNPALMLLLLLGLDKFPTDQSLLHDLAFFHEHHGMLSELISRYTLACTLENESEAFAELAMDFHYNTIGDGFEAINELKKIVMDNPQKEAAIDHLLLEHEISLILPDNITIM
jgi:hypothetical protein